MHLDSRILTAYSYILLFQCSTKDESDIFWRKGSVLAMEPLGSGIESLLRKN